MQVTLDLLNKDFANREDPTSIGGICRNAHGSESVWQFGKHIATRHTIEAPEEGGPVHRWSADVAQWNCSPPREPVPEGGKGNEPKETPAEPTKRPCLEEFVSRGYAAENYDSYFADLGKHGHPYGPGWSDPNWKTPAPPPRAEYEPDEPLVPVTSPEAPPASVHLEDFNQQGIRKPRTSETHHFAEPTAEEPQAPEASPQAAPETTTAQHKGSQRPKGK